MACKYIFDGHTFNSEVELDDFLIESGRYLSQLGDIVFSFTAKQNYVHSIIDNIKKKSKEEYNLYMKWVNDEKAYTYGEDGEEEIVKKPYTGINAYLASLTDPQLFPEFRDKDYWNNRFNSWRKGQFDASEKETLQIDIYLTESELKEKYANATNEELDSFRDKIKEKWKFQCRSGDAVHEVFQLYFTRKYGKFGFEQDNVIRYILDNMSKRNIDFLPKKDGKININSIVAQAENIRHQLESKYISKDGESLMYFPEFIITDTVAKKGNLNTDKVLGKIDLLIIDPKGQLHIVDYKTSIKSTTNSAKELTYKYQLAAYARILNRHGLNMYSGDLLIAPIKLQNFRKNEDVYIYDDVEVGTKIESLDLSSKIMDNLEEFLPSRHDINITTQKAQEKTGEWMSKNFPAYIADRLLNEKLITKHLKKLGVFNKKNSNGEYEYQPNDSTEKIVDAEEAGLVQKVLKYRQSLLPKKLKVMGQIKRYIQDGINSHNVNFPIYSSARKNVSPTWLKDTLGKYCDGNWEIVDNEIWDAYGIICLKDNTTNQVDFIKISTNYLTSNHTEFKGNKSFYQGIGLASKWQSDVDENSKFNSLMLEAVNGNIELMELLCLLTTTGSLQGTKIGNLGVLNPWDSEYILPTNEELLYSFNQLQQFNPVEDDKFSSGEIQFANRFERVRNLLFDILNAGQLSNWKDDYNVFENVAKSCTSIFDNITDDITTQQQIDKLLELDEILKSSTFKKADELEASYTDSRNLAQLHIQLHNEIQLAITALKGINFRQQLKDHNKWAESILIWKRGLSGSYTDNPGNLSSETLNLITKLVLECYQNVRDDTLKAKAKLDKYTKTLKEDKNIGYIGENLYVNQADLYKNLYEEKDGDLLFKDVNDPSLSIAEKEYLEYALDVINKNRFNCSEETLQDMKESHDLKYYRVPLARGDIDSLASSRGLIAAFREKIKEFNPKYIFEKTQQAVEGIEYIERTEEPTELIYKMTNMFDCGEESIDKRIKIIQSVGIQNLERNLETLVLKHQFAYFQQEQMNTVFPVIKAATIHLQQEGAKLNQVYEDDLQYTRDYIENKIFNRSIVNPKLKEANKILQYIRNAASRLTLAFSPVQMFYQPLQGFWQTISLIARKPNGTQAFSIKNVIKAYKLVYADLFNFSGKPTLISRLNELYGINDMDMNQFVERILKNKKGIWNMDNLMMKFSNRPDYYNRMIIFVSQMLEDGSFYAHSLDKDGNLVYNWKEDKRFEKYAANPTLKTNDPEYNRQKALYYAMAFQFKTEHVKSLDGSNFEINMQQPIDLPRAYTNKQAESIKNIADDIYGYYSHEKKSMIQATALGGMWLQFKTYWSGKKNQYLRSGGVKLQGHFVPKVEKKTLPDGSVIEIHWYNQVDKDGNIIKDVPPIPDKKPSENYTGPIATEDSQKISPYTVWEGRWQEGIILTLADIFKDKHIFDNFKSKWNEENDILRICYRSNLKQLGIDLFMFGILGSLLGSLLGDWLEDLKRENKDNKDFVTGCGIAAANIMVYSVKNSFLDFNFFDSIGSPLGQWTPFAFDFVSRQAANVYNVAMGDEDFWDGMLKVASVGRQLKPMFDSLKPDMFRTKQEGGTWESRAARRNRERRENE